ncbi:MAG TPA: hypothetical protein PLL26_07475 [Candidatus Dojkabacteria bacterium]|nr:hypothetical protein [Candidatus Dojkabacteria bacterium]
MRKFRFLILVALSFGFAKTYAQNDNPYAIFGYQGKVLKTPEEESGKQFLILNTNDTTQILKSITFNTKTQLIEYIDQDDKIYKTDSLLPTFVLRFISTDPHTKDYPSLTPYNFVGNMPTRAVDPDGRDIYILFATSGNHRGDAMMSAARDTRQRNIENSMFFDPAKDKVVVLQVQDMAQIKTMVEQTVTTYSAQYGQTREVCVFSHGAWHGPTGTVLASEDAVKNEDGSNGKQMTPEGWAKIDFNWVSSGASFTMYGCNTGNDIKEGSWVGSFTRTLSKLSNFDNVQVSGQSTSAFPSFYPNIRETNVARSYYSPIGFLSGDTYMVGGNKGDGSSSMWFTPSSAPLANPMNIYKEGEKVGSGNQSTTKSNPITY